MYRACLIFLIILLAIAATYLDYNSRYRPSADDLYGCTPRHQAPNGECK